MSDQTPADSPESDDPSGPAGTGDGASFNMKQLNRLGAMMDKFDLSEVRLRRSTDTAEEQWTLRRGVPQVAAAPVAMPAASVAPAAAPAPAAAAAPADSGGGDAGSGSGGAGVFITSPTVGTFYAKPSPDDPPFVKIGDTVSAETIVCLIEAMKVFNQIPADKAGKIAKVLVSEGEAVEHGQPLFELA